MTGDELIENEKARKKIRDLDQVKVSDQTYEAAKEKLKIMRSIEKEIIVHLPVALMDCCETAAYHNLPSSRTAELMKEAKDMSELFGGPYINEYVEMEERVVRHRLSNALGLF